MSALLEQASSFEGVSSSSTGKGTRSSSAKANDRLHAFFMPRKSPERKVICTTSSVLKENKSVFDRGLDSLLMYIERNATWELPKAFAIVVMGTALADWNEGVYEAAQKSSNVTHYSEHTIRNWMQLYIQTTSDLLSHGKDTITDKDVEECLASERGHFSQLDSLISGEDFQLSARTYVRSNACKKGEPNLTSGMFAVWVKEDMTLTSVKKQQAYGFTHLDLGILITKKEFILMDTSAKMLYNTGVNF